MIIQKPPTTQRKHVSRVSTSPSRPHTSSRSATSISNSWHQLHQHPPIPPKPSETDLLFPCSHPVHPATVHWPLAFLTTSYGLDALLYSHAYLPSSLTSLLPAATELSRISYYALGLGVLTALPSISSGVAQGIKMVQAQGLYGPDGKLKQKVKILAAHAVVNDVVVAASAWLWWQRRNAGAVAQVMEGKNPVAYTATSAQVGISVLLGVFLLFAANLGGSLVYDYGTGLAMGKKVIKGEKQG